MNLKLILFLIVVSFASKSYSQYSLSFGNVNPLISDTAYMESLLGISLTIKNVGTEDINFPISILIRVNAYYPEELAQFFFNDTTPLLVGESFQINWPEFDPSSGLVVGGFIEVSQERGFVVGDNIIVVWPSVSPNVEGPEEIVTVEQYVHQVHIINELASVPVANDDEFKLIRSPYGIEIWSKKAVVLTEVYNIEGQKVVLEHDTKLNIQNLPPGLYVVSSALSDGSRKFVKILIH